MGGLVARALLTLQDFNPDLISLIITQATPHIAPVLTVDRYLLDFYDTVNSYWLLNANTVKNVTVLSVGGGFRDYQVRSGLTILPSLNIHNTTISVVSSAVPRVWISTDHLAIVWCKELVLSTVRALFDLVEPDSNQITQNQEKMKFILSHHFVKHTAVDHEEEADSMSPFFGLKSVWTEIGSSSWSYSGSNEPRGKYFSFPVLSHRRNFSHFHCQSSVLDGSPWLYGCTKSDISVCLEGMDLSLESELLPTFKIVTLSLNHYLNLSHIIVYIPRTNGNKEFTLHCEFFSEESRTATTQVPNVFSFGISASKVDFTSSGLMHTLQLQDFNQIYQAFTVYVESKCHSLTEELPSVYRWHIPWSNEDSFTAVSVPSSVEISAKLHVARPVNDSSVSVLHLYTSRDCQYQITIRTSFFQVLGQVIRFHGVCLPVYIVSNILLGYGRQLSNVLSTGHSVEFDVALDSAAKPYKVDPIVNVLKLLLRFTWFNTVWALLFLPELDAVILTNQGNWYPLVSLFLFLFGTGIAYWSCILFHFFLKLLSSLWGALRRPSVVSEHGRLITPGGLGLIIFLNIISWMTCGAFALLVIYLLYVFKVVGLLTLIRTLKNVLNLAPKRKAENEKAVDSRNVPENCGVKECPLPNARLPALGRDKFVSVSAIDEAVDNLRMHFTVLNLVTWAVLLSAPSLTYWFKNLRYEKRLDPDPCRHVATVLIIALGILIKSSTASMKTSKLLKHVARIQLPVSVAVVAFGLVHLYRVSYFIAFSLVLHALSCFV
ncbi:GPI inositol-deacylase [Protopterus annectens]|uniref:GPI inositol-deacylase n=1 Tax=Protopterus annectens TaxID=7888 RepID=UPI001CFC4234|nr:GPI inositol-deacylase [Protopterus annectens]